MATIKTYDAVEHAVTDTWFEKNVQPFPHLQEMDEGQHEWTRQAILRESGKRELLPEEDAQLRALTCWQNVNRAWRWLEGRHYNEVGLDHLDQVHGNKSTYPCGCVTQHVFDHNKAIAGEEFEIHPHVSKKACPQHIALLRDYKAHFAQVQHDNSSES